MRPTRALLVPTLLAAACAAPAPVAEPDALDRYMRDELRARRIPGAAVAVVQRGELAALRTYGFANLETGTPVWPETKFAIASLDKQFTAAMVLLLARDQKLSLDDPIGKHLLDAPSTWSGIRIRHLLTHTSGMPDDWLETHEGRGFTDYTTDQLYRHARTRPLLFAPGSGWSYSDQGYFLLCLIVERAEGVPYFTALQRRILQPLRMDGVAVANPHAVVAGRAAGYLLQGEELRNNRRLVDYGLWNDLLMTVGDFVKWDRALRDATILTRDELERAWTPARLDGGEVAHAADDLAGYGFGWMVDTFRGRRLVQHSGYTGVYFLRLLDDDVSVVLFTNLERPSGSAPRGLALGVAGLFAPTAPWANMPPKPDAVAPAVAALLRDELARWQRGECAAARYAPDGEARGREIAAAMRTDLGRMGAILEVAVLDDERTEDGQLVCLRAECERGTLFVRVQCDAGGRILRARGDRL
jgi:CubicO group peptidase (beta-lactamase class C family)